MPSIVRIDVEHADGTAFGTGFAIGPGRVVTNLHVIDGGLRASVRLRDGLRFSVRRVLAFDEKNDLAILGLAGEELPELPIADSDQLSAGARIYAIGNPFGLDYTITDGLFSGRRPLEPGIEVLQVSVLLSPGSSGGPLLDERGRVIGVATRSLPSASLGLGIPSNQLRSLLRDVDSRGGQTFDEFAALRSPPRSVGRRSRKRVRAIPDHPLALLTGCSEESLRAIVGAIQSAIQNGAPIYNSGDPEACYRIYEGTALRLNGALASTCQGGAEALKQGLDRSDRLESYDDKAWAMRDTFDGLLDVIDRSIRENR